MNRGYAEQAKRDTLQKGYFPSTPRFLFHTLLMCVSNKTTSFNEIPTKIQCLGYAILNNKNFNYSQDIFDDLVKNVDNKAFLLFPRFLSYYFEQKFVKEDAELPKQGASFKINCLTPETFSRMLAPIKTKAEVPEQNLADEIVPQVSAAEPTAPGDQSSTPTVLKPTPATTKKTKKKTSRKPTKPKPKAPLEDEIPESMPVTAQKSPITTDATSSQQMEERSQPLPQTPPASSQKDQVVSTGTPQYEALDPLGSIFHSPNPKDMSLSTPSPSPSILPQSMIPLLHTVGITQTQTSSSQTPITESILPQVTGSDVDISVILATTEEVTLQELQVIPVSSSSGAATTNVEPAGLHLDSGYIHKTPLKAISSIAPLRTTSEFVLTTGNIKRLSSAEERSPQYQEQGASMADFWDSVPKSYIGKTTAGGDSDDPVNSGDDSKYQELTGRVENLETSVAEIKDMVQQLLKAQKAQSTAPPAQAPAQQAPAVNELCNLFQPLLERQKQMADQQHAIHVQKLTNMVESRFKDTQADIKAIKAHIQSASGKVSSTVLFMNEPFPDNAKKGEKIKWKKKGIDDGMYVESENSQTKTAVSTHTTSPHTTSPHTTSPHTTTTTAPPPSVSTAPKPPSPSKTANPSSPPAKKQKTADVITSVVMATVVETLVVPTTVSQPLTITQTTAITTPAQKQKTSADTPVAVMTTAVEAPVVSTAVSQPSTTALTFPTSQPKLFTRKRKPISADENMYDSNAAKYPLELEAIKNEMRQFNTEEDPSKRRFPSLIGFMVPEDMDDYLKLKARQAKVRAKVESKDERVCTRTEQRKG
ncbi:hypothetical protein HanIR_Chr16g0808011 [Helianthus annuus]|nr:hypothetical protein HanIR_Chr16g0808011 [Helianthus annuus]